MDFQYASLSNICFKSLSATVWLSSVGDGDGEWKMTEDDSERDHELRSLTAAELRPRLAVYFNIWWFLCLYRGMFDCYSDGPCCIIYWSSFTGEYH